MKRRDRQILALGTGTSPEHSNGETRQLLDEARKDFAFNRWIRISLKAQSDKTLVFNNLLTHINVESLEEAFHAIDGSKALGVDSISKAEYGKNLETNLKNLAQSIHQGRYKPLPKREILIPKANGKTRPIAIACFEDKLVDWVIGKILTQLYEPLFIKTSFGYRPNKAATQAVEACYHSLCKNTRKHVVEIDFSNFFNTIPHRKLMRILGKRISDNRFKGLIFKEEKDAKRFLINLRARVEPFGLKLNEEKTRLLKLEKHKHEQFNFLGFTFYWGKQASRVILKVKTQKEKLVKAMQEFDHWIKRIRNQLKLGDIWKLAKAKISGHNNYYGYWMNATKLNHYYTKAIWSLFKWLNRRSQKRSYTWEGFKERLKHFPLMQPLEAMKLKQLGWSPYA